MSLSLAGKCLGDQRDSRCDRYQCWYIAGDAFVAADLVEDNGTENQTVIWMTPTGVIDEVLYPGSAIVFQADAHPLTV